MSEVRPTPPDDDGERQIVRGLGRTLEALDLVEHARPQQVRLALGRLRQERFEPADSELLANVVARLGQAVGVSEDHVPRVELDDTLSIGGRGSMPSG